jgi:hypothetical protein
MGTEKILGIGVIDRLGLYLSFVRFLLIRRRNRLELHVVEIVKHVLA